jgi:hypothetical protein
MLESSKIERSHSVPAPFQERFVQDGIQEAQSLIRSRFELAPPEKEDNLDFHNIQHTEDVIRRTENILRAIQRVTVHVVSEKDIALGRLAAAFHDVVQEWKEQEAQGKTLRQRFIGKNEEASADEAIAFLDREASGQADQGLSEEDFEIVAEAIRGTVPGFSMEKKTVIQPNITEQSSLVARALALADIGTAGMDGAENFLREGDALFREENLDIMRALRNQEELSNEVKEGYRNRMIAWSKFQPIFAKGRQELLDEELRGLPLGADVAIKKLFNTFDESISASARRGEERESMSFDELALDMGFFEKKPMNH